LGRSSWDCRADDLRSLLVDSYLDLFGIAMATVRDSLRESRLLTHPVMLSVFLHLSSIFPQHQRLLYTGAFLVFWLQVLLKNGTVYLLVCFLEQIGFRRAST
jgi:hypothetical protein